jgi:hypothetical protein
MLIRKAAFPVLSRLSTKWVDRRRSPTSPTKIVVAFLVPLSLSLSLLLLQFGPAAIARSHLSIDHYCQRHQPLHYQLIPSPTSDACPSKRLVEPNSLDWSVARTDGRTDGGRKGIWRQRQTDRRAIIGRHATGEKKRERRSRGGQIRTKLFVYLELR